jgi:hypothetical protein
MVTREIEMRARHSTYSVWEDQVSAGLSTEIRSPHTNSIFQQSFWLDAVAPGAWDVVEIEAGGQVKARLPYVISRSRLGMTILSMPRLTQTLGPWLAPAEGKYAAQLARHKELMSALFAQLPAHDLFSQNFHHSITNWLPLHWQGFNQTTRYTYVIDGLSDVEKVWARFEAEARRDIRRAREHLVVRSDPDIEHFLDLNDLTFKRQGKKLPYSRELVRRLDTACAERGLRRMFFAEDSEGRTHAAVYIVWDQDSAYYLMGAADPELRNSGATSLLLWEAIQFAATVTRSFDFEGSMIESIERFFRAFGAKQVPYFHISRMSPRMAVLRGLSDSLDAVKRLMRRR